MLGNGEGGNVDCTDERGCFDECLSAHSAHAFVLLIVDATF